MSDPFSRAPCAHRDGESSLETDESSWPVGPTLDPHHPGQGLCPPNTVVVNWETVPLWTLGGTGRLLQEALRGTDMFDPASSIHAPYSVGRTFWCYPLFSSYLLGHVL